MQRVLVIGSSGAGKSTLSRRMGEILQLPVIHLDVLFWKRGWVESSGEEMLMRTREALTGDAWIIDGNFSATLDIRIERADTIIFLDLPRGLCVRRILTRWWQYFGRTRPDLPEGCPEKIDFEFLEWVWDYPRRSRPKVVKALSRYTSSKRIIVLQSPVEVERFVADLEQPCG